jgi:hypothetical protein
MEPFLLVSTYSLNFLLIAFTIVRITHLVLNRCISASSRGDCQHSPPAFTLAWVTTATAGSAAGYVRDDLRGGRRFDLLDDASGYHRDLDDAIEALVERRPDDDVGGGINLLADAGGGLIDLEEDEILRDAKSIEASDPLAGGDMDSGTSRAEVTQAPRLHIRRADRGAGTTYRVTG